MFESALIEVELHRGDIKPISLESWMQNLPDEVRNLPLHCLSIPGSHDSLSSSITQHSDISPDNASLYNSMVVRSAGCISKRIIYNWCRTQALDCRQQLDNGIRYFDLRIAKKSEDGELYIAHGLYGIQIRDVLVAMRDFLTTHRGEVILLDFQHLYDMNHFDHHKLLHQLMDVLGPLMCPYVQDLSQLTLSYLWEKGFQVIVFYRDPIANHNPFLWPSESIPNPWPNTRSLKNLFAFLTDIYHGRRREAGKFFVSQSILTPNKYTVVGNLFSNLKNCLVQGSNLELVKWLSDKHPGPYGLNIVICDFIDYEDCAVPRGIIECNYRSPLIGDVNMGKDEIVNV